MSQESTKDHAFVIDTLGHLLHHIATTDEEDLGNKEILCTLIAKEIRERSSEILKH